MVTSAVETRGGPARTAGRVAGVPPRRKVRRDTREAGGRERGAAPGDAPGGGAAPRRGHGRAPLDASSDRHASHPDDGSDPLGAELAARARAGDRGAFSELYARYAPAVHGVLVTRVSVQDAGDLVQEVFLSALRSIGSLGDPGRIGPWLCTIARNRARDLHRARGGAGVVALDGLDGSHEPAAPPAHTAGDADEAEEAARALDALRELPEAYRETLALRLVEGLSGPEIAARTGLTHGSVRVNLHRGMKLLRTRLQPEGGPS